MVFFWDIAREKNINYYKVDNLVGEYTKVTKQDFLEA